MGFDGTALLYSMGGPSKSSCDLTGQAISDQNATDANSLRRAHVVSIASVSPESILFRDCEENMMITGTVGGEGPENHFRTQELL
jgi:hypothetical protein